MSDDGGNSWQRAGLDGKPIFDIFRKGANIWAGSGNGVYRASLADINWLPVGTLDKTVYSLVTDGDGRNYTGTRDDRVFRWNGSTWQPFATGLTSPRIFWLIQSKIDANKIIAGTTDGVWANTVLPVATSTPTPTNTPTPTPTPTNTPTNTPTPIVTPTVTPGIEFIRLRNQPDGSIAPGEELTYTIEYKNGPYALSNVQISNEVPTNVVTIPESFEAGAGGNVVIPDPDQIDPGSLVIWNFPNGLPKCPGKSCEGLITYQVRRPAPTPTPEPTDLFITKSGPAFASAGDSIAYALTITNYTSITLTNVVITDVIPAGTRYDGGADSINGGNATWTEQELKAGASVSKMLSVIVRSGVQKVENQEYSVSGEAEDGTVHQVAGNQPVVTVIGDEPVAPPEPEYVIVNEGARMVWEYNGKLGALRSGGVRNPMYYNHLPLVFQSNGQHADQGAPGAR